MTSVADLIAGTATQRTADDLPPEPQEPPQYTEDDLRPICNEPGCEKACRKRRGSDDYHPYCSEHNKLHTPVGDRTPRSQSVHKLEEQRRQAAQRIERNVTGWLAMVQTGLIASDDLYCAKAVGDEGPHIAKALGDLSMDFPLLKRVLETGDKWGSLSILMFHMVKLGSTIGVHHGWVPYDGPIRFIVPPPSMPMGPQPSAQPYGTPQYAHANNTDPANVSFA